MAHLTRFFTILGIGLVPLASSVPTGTASEGGTCTTGTRSCTQDGVGWAYCGEGEWSVYTCSQGTICIDATIGCSWNSTTLTAPAAATAQTPGLVSQLPSSYVSSSAKKSTSLTPSSTSYVSSSAKKSTSSTSASPSTPAIQVDSADSSSASISVTQAQFDAALNMDQYPVPTTDQYNAFINGISASGITSKMELAMFLAQIMHESDGLSELSEQGCPCAGYGTSPSGVGYWGRGYIQLSYTANYEAASEYLFPNAPDTLVDNPDLVATDQDVAWGVSFGTGRCSCTTRPA